jgi:hypothetical protein
MSNTKLNFNSSSIQEIAQKMIEISLFLPSGYRAAMIITANGDMSFTEPLPGSTSLNQDDYEKDTDILYIDSCDLSELSLELKKDIITIHRGSDNECFAFGEDERIKWNEEKGDYDCEEMADTYTFAEMVKKVASICSAEENDFTGFIREFKRMKGVMTKFEEAFVSAGKELFESFTSGVTELFENIGSAATELTDEKKKKNNETDTS